ncbi:MerR family transcriptional regulator [Shewanella acanthi]|uniref:MerR family transcriptional regulator n=1 Tax=Shewanella acanthi TaxID=2864212 RepID=UPI001C662348|nr:MerR family transcriptional regulator [Shewanella acanthi]QYJ79776.1 MerR family transcriptional regulator [Shewanella acanthi]
MSQNKQIHNDADHIDQKSLTADEHNMLSIGEVSELTGVNAVTLRAWQRRFGLVVPQRTPKGHRLYTAENIAQIHEINAWLAKGVAISKVKPLLNSRDVIAIENLAMDHHYLSLNEEKGSNDDSEYWAQAISSLMRSVSEFDPLNLHQRLDEILNLYPFTIVKDKLLLPWIYQLETLIEPRLDAELLMAWLNHELLSRIWSRFHNGHGGQVKVALFGLNGRSQTLNSNLTKRLYKLVLRMELVSLKVTVTDFAEQGIGDLALLDGRVDVDALLLIPNANHVASELAELKSLIEQMSLPCYLIGPFAPTLTDLNSYLKPDIAPLVEKLLLKKQEQKALLRQQKNALKNANSSADHGKGK